MTLVTKTEKRLGLLNFVIQYPSRFIRDIQTMAFGMCLDTTYHRSHMGLFVTSVWNMKVTTEEVAKMEHEDDKFASTTLTSIENARKAQGKPGQSLKSIEEQMAEIECYIIHLEAFLSEKAHHKKMIRQLRVVLQEKIMNGPLVQSQLNDIFWLVFLDGQKYFQFPEGKPTSGLDSLVGMLSRNTMTSLIRVSYHQLSPAGGNSKCQKLSDSVYTPAGGGCKQWIR